MCGGVHLHHPGFPLLLASDASLADLNERLEARQQKAVPMNRFRPNLVFGGKGGEGGEGGAPPFAEDGWAAVAIGPRGELNDVDATSFSVVKPYAPYPHPVPSPHPYSDPDPRPVPNLTYPSPSPTPSPSLLS